MWARQLGDLSGVCIPNQAAEQCVPPSPATPCASHPALTLTALPPTTHPRTLTCPQRGGVFLKVTVFELLVNGLLLPQSLSAGLGQLQGH